jgi:integrase
MIKVRYRYTRSYRDRHGKLRVEYRRNGRTIALPTNVGTAEFQAAYDAAKASVEGGQPISLGREKPRAGALHWLCAEYFRAAEFGQLGKVTQEERRRQLEHTLREPAKPGSQFLFGDYPAAAVERKHIVVLLDRKRHVPDTANHRLKALRGLFKWASDNKIGGVTENPAANVPKLKVKGGGHHTWTEEERDAYKRRHPLGTMARLAYDLFFETGQRLGDVRTMGRHLIQIRGGKRKLCFTQEKNRERKPVYLELVILPALQESLDATPTGDLRFLVNAHGRPFASKKSFGNWFADRCAEAGLPQRCTAHGLRKAAATYHAERGASASELMAIFGWQSLRTADIYLKNANQARLAEQAFARVTKAKP